MKVDLELLTFIGVVLTLIISIFSIWDRIKPKYSKFSVYLKDRRLLIIKNLGQKKGKILRIEINGSPLRMFSLDEREFPITLEENGKIEYRILVNDSIPTPKTCSLIIKGLIFKENKTFSI